MRQLSMGAVTAALMLAGCVQQPPPNRISYPQQSSIVPPAPQYAYGPPQPPAYQNDTGSYAAYDDVPQDPSAGIYIDPPLDQPPPLRVEWAPPPLLIESPPPPPYPDAIWTGGYWVWQDNWVWARGRWLAPPRPGYRWMRPYYEHRGDSVIFINGFWAAPGVSFRRPPPTLNIPFARVRQGVARGPRPNGPDGPFMPPPHGARRGTFVPASVPEPQAPRPPDRRGQQPDRPDRSFQDRQPDRDQNRDQNRGQDRGRDAQRPSPQAVTPPPPSRPQEQPQIAPPRPDRQDRQDRPNRPDRPDREHQDRNINGNPAERAQQPPRPPRPEPQARQPQAMPRPQPQAVPHVPPPAARPAPQPRPEHRAPPPSRDRSADPAEPVQREGGDRGRRDRDR